MPPGPGPAGGDLPPWPAGCSGEGGEGHSWERTMPSTSLPLTQGHELPRKERELLLNPPK